MCGIYTAEKCNHSRYQLTRMGDCPGLNIGPLAVSGAVVEICRDI